MFERKYTRKEERFHEPSMEMERQAIVDFGEGRARDAETTKPSMRFQDLAITDWPESPAYASTLSLGLVGLI